MTNLFGPILLDDGLDRFSIIKSASLGLLVDLVLCHRNI